MFPLTAVVHSKSRTPAASVSSSPPLTDADKNEICLFFIRRNCSFKGTSDGAVFTQRCCTDLLGSIKLCGSTPPLSKGRFGLIFLRQVRSRPLAPALQMAGL